MARMVWDVRNRTVPLNPISFDSHLNNDYTIISANALVLLIDLGGESIHFELRRTTRLHVPVPTPISTLDYLEKYIAFV